VRGDVGRVGPPQDALASTALALLLVLVASQQWWNHASSLSCLLTG
jgi:hypothetical protein